MIIFLQIEIIKRQSRTNASESEGSTKKDVMQKHEKKCDTVQSIKSPPINDEESLNQNNRVILIKGRRLYDRNTSIYVDENNGTSEMNNEIFHPKFKNNSQMNTKIIATKEMGKSDYNQKKKQIHFNK